MGLRRRYKENLINTDADTQNYTLLSADILGGVLTHTSVTGGGTITTDTALNIINDCGLKRDNDCITCFFVNDGSQTDTFAGGTGVTVADTGSTCATNEGAWLLFRRTSATAVTMYSVGGP